MLYKNTNRKVKPNMAYYSRRLEHPGAGFKALPPAVKY